jgi:3-hydroxyacyl-CoA dehydrogenase
LRESLALVDAGVIEPRELDLVVSEGLGKRLAALGPFATIAIGGEEIFQSIAARLYPVLSTASEPPEAVGRLRLTSDEIEDLCRMRDDRLAFSSAAADLSSARPDPNAVVA